MTLLRPFLLLTLLSCLIAWRLEVRHERVLPPPLTASEERACMIVKPEWDSTLVVETDRAYWTMGNNIKICVRER